MLIARWLPILRFSGPIGSEQLERLQASLSRFVYHEAFHLWNAKIASESTPGSTKEEPSMPR